jgi:hypothetical protein
MSCLARPMVFFKLKYPYNTAMLREWEHNHEYLAVRRVRTDSRRKAGVGSCSGHVGRSYKEGRLLDND